MKPQILQGNWENPDIVTVRKNLYTVSGMRNVNTGDTIHEPLLQKEGSSI